MLGVCARPINLKRYIPTRWKLIVCGACLLLGAGWLVAHRDPTPRVWRMAQAPARDMHSVEALLGPPSYRSLMGDGQAWGYHPAFCVYTFWLWFDGSGKFSYAAVTDDA